MKTLKEFSDLHYEPFVGEDGRTWYRLLVAINYESHRFDEEATVPAGEESDGATGPARDIVSKSWWIHDHLRKTRKWDSGNKCTNWQASGVIFDVLMKEKRYVRAPFWFAATLCWGYLVECMEFLGRH